MGIEPIGLFYLEIRMGVPKDFVISSFADLIELIETGKVDPSKLAVWVDNDRITFDYGWEYDEDGCEVQVGPGISRAPDWDPNPRVALEEVLQLLLNCEVRPA
jgi:flavin-dependent dehydrogenase